MNPPPEKPPIFVAPPVYRPGGALVLGRVLVANRGEIACRIIRTCKQLFITTVAVFANEDQDALHVQQADEAVCIGPADTQPYQNIKALVETARAAKADAVHPGYGYLSENAAFASAVAAAGIVFIGPSPASIAQLGDKRDAKEYLGQHSSVPLIPGYGGKDQDPIRLQDEADKIGYPVLIKASAGGGGKGMRIVRDQSGFHEALLRCTSEAERSFGSGHCLIEKYIESGKHIEIQVFGDGETFVSLLDRECSVQRRHQKLVEESPSPWLSPDMRRQMSDCALEIARLLKYESAGTVEFIVDIKQETFYFLEVNTRIQVEHPITEEVVGVDIVALQLYVAAGGRLSSLPELGAIRQHGHAIEVRLCAENPFNNFLPCTGTVSVFSPPSDAGWKNLRFEAGVRSGSTVSVHFDSMICKIVAWAPHRDEAITKIISALRNTVCLGVVTNQIFLLRIMLRLNAPDYTTAFIEQRPELLAPVDQEHVEGPMLMAALLFDRRHEALAVSRPAFASIPAGFRNQRRDRNTVSRTFVTCRVDLLGCSTSGTVMVTQSGADTYELARVEDETPVTAAEREVFFNKQGGPLTRRFYHATKSKLSGQYTARLLSSEGAAATGPRQGSESRVGLLLNEKRHYTFEAARTFSDDNIREVTVFSKHIGGSVTFVLRNALSWAGKFDKRGRDGTMGGDAKRRYLSPMPCHILQILAADGSTVKSGDGLLVMESMKTEIRIVAETAGVVRMHVQADAKISEGVIMCEVAPADEEETA